ncbi:uncharacterized protein BT62DRAFT_964369, partial [Guyanagaster necrorhizus]
MSSSCQGLLAALKDCLMHSDCVVKEGKLPSECLKEHPDELPEACQSLRKATFECKRGMVGIVYDIIPLMLLNTMQLDMRKRFRGNIAGSQFT